MKTVPSFCRAPPLAALLRTMNTPSSNTIDEPRQVDIALPKPPNPSPSSGRGNKRRTGLRRASGKISRSCQLART